MTKKINPLVEAYNKSKQGLCNFKQFRPSVCLTDKDKAAKRQRLKAELRKVDLYV